MSPKYQDDIDVKLLEKICQLYEVSVEDLNFLVAIDHNFVYEFTKNDKAYILRGGTRHPPEQVKAELEWIQFLDSYGVKASLPILSVNNNYHELINYQGKEINATVFEKAPGKEIEFRNSDEWNADIWEEMGRTLGRMHKAAVKFNKSEPKNKRLTAFESVHVSSTDILDPVEDALIIERFNELKKKLQQLPKAENSFGLIQYDFHPGNFNIHEKDLIVYDFDDSYYFFFIYDLAACIHEIVWAISDERKMWLANQFIPALWKGYCEEFNLDRNWLKYLPDFLKWREFIIYTTVVETLKDETTPKEYIAEYQKFAKEFKERTESEKQIVPITENMSIWFQEF